MVLSQSPASRFFAAVYKWNIHTQRPRTCRLSCPYSRNSRLYPTRGCVQKCHATGLARQQGQLESQLQDEGQSALAEGARNYVRTDTDQFGRVKPAAAAKEEVDIEPKVPPPVTVGQELPSETVDLDPEDEKLKKVIRGVFRKVPSSVAVITVESVDPEIRKHVPMGVAVSSLSSVTLDPPTISFNIKQPSKTLDAIRAAHGLFRVHFLAASPGGATVVELFCHGNHPEAYKQRYESLKLLVPSYREDETALRSLAPQILSETICAAMECTITHEFPVADHVILVARVNSVEQQMSKEPTIAYADGKYMRTDTTIAPHGSSSMLTHRGSKWSVWDYPLFFGEKARKDYSIQIRTIINSSPEYFDKPLFEVNRSINSSFPYPPANFGIDVYNIIKECRQGSGHSDEQQTEKEITPALFEFYGRLTPHAMTIIIDRAKTLVKEVPGSLYLHYSLFLSRLSVSSGNNTLLPSDIMNALRAEGLVSDLGPSNEDYKTDHTTILDLETLEQVELKLRGHLRTLPYWKTLPVRFETIVKSFGLDKSAAFHFRRCRSRLVTETHPQQFRSPQIEIMGEVSQAEARVVLSRIIRYLHADDPLGFKRLLRTPSYEALRINHVHPTITGMDIEYLYGKLNHLYNSIPLFDELQKAIANMLEPWLENTVEWNDLKNRTKKFVQETPLRATLWPNKDKLAAMGLHWHSKVTVILPNRGKIQQRLDHGNLLDLLVAKELKKYYGQGSDEENQAIARYLKEMYKFDVHSEPIAYTSQDSANRSSSDEMEEAMLANLNVNVSNSTR